MGDDSADAVEASDAADALGVNAWPSSGSSAPDEMEGVTARIVDFCGGDGTSSRTSNPLSLVKKSGGGEDGGVLPWENRLDDGENEEATKVSASDARVDVECLIAFLCCRGFGSRVLLDSIFATALATTL